MWSHLAVSRAATVDSATALRAHTGVQGWTTGWVATALVCLLFGSCRRAPATATDGGVDASGAGGSGSPSGIGGAPGPGAAGASGAAGVSGDAGAAGGATAGAGGAVGSGGGGPAGAGGSAGTGASAGAGGSVAPGGAGGTGGAAGAGAAGTGGAAAAGGAGGTTGPGTGGISGAGGPAGAGATGLGGAPGTGGAAGAAGTAGSGGASGSGGSGGNGGRTGSWGAPFRIDEGLIESWDASVAVSAAGDVFVAASNEAGIWIRRYLKASDGFEAWALVDAARGYARIAVDDAGNAIFVVQTEERYDIFARRFDGNTWGDRQILQAGQPSGPPLLAQELNELVMTGSGHGAVSWRRLVSTPSGEVATFYLSLYDAGRGWGTLPLSSNPYANLSIVEVDRRLRLCMAASVYDPNRRAADVWVSDMKYDLTTGVVDVGADELLHQSQGTLVAYPAGVGSDPAGNCTVGIHERTAGIGMGNVLAAADVGGTWGSPVVLNSQLDVRSVQLAVGRGGHPLVIWCDCQNSGQNCAVRARRFAGGAWQAETEVAMAISSPIDQQRIAVDGRGRALVTWVQRDRNTRMVALMASELDPAFGWTAPHVLSALPSGANGFIVRGLAFGPNGTGVAVWQVHSSMVGPPMYAAIFRH
jgi:hypothetical protein